MGPMCFDYGFGPFRWVCTSGKPEDLQITDDIACEVLEEMMKDAPKENDNHSRNEKDPKAPFNGHSQRVLLTDIRAAVAERDQKFNEHPMVMKVLIAECLSDLIQLHTSIGVDQFKEEDDQAGFCWLRDAGKLQAALSQILEVEMPDDFMTRQ